MILATDPPFWVQFVLIAAAGAAGTLTTAMVVWGFHFGGRIQRSVQATEEKIPDLTNAMTLHGAQMADLHNCLDDVQADVRSLKEDMTRVLAAIATNTAITSAARDEAEAR